MHFPPNKDEGSSCQAETAQIASFLLNQGPILFLKEKGLTCTR
jgi:hypothetical protein